LLLAARLHVERVILDAFVAGIADCADQGAAALLTQLGDLYVLSSIEADRGWFQEHGRLSAARGKVGRCLHQAYCCVAATSAIVKAPRAIPQPRRGARGRETHAGYGS
jgi:hypothetical protein